MGYDVSAEGALGLLLSDCRDKLGDLCNAFEDAVNADRDADADIVERLDETTAAFVPRFIAAFAAIGVEVPASAWLFHTGNDDDRPGGAATGSDDWVLGFSIYTQPWEYPELSQSFRDASRFHTWVIGG